MPDMKLVKLEIRFKCPNPECGVGDMTNGAECLRCVLMHVYGDQQIYNESQRKPTEGDLIDLAQGSLPHVEQTMDATDLEFLASPITVLMAQREWSGPALEKAVELNRGLKTNELAPILSLVPEDDKP